MKRLSNILSVLLALGIMMCSISAYATGLSVDGTYVPASAFSTENDVEKTTNNTVKSDGSLLFDVYDLLSDSEEEKIESKLNDISEKHNMDIAVVIVNGLDGKSPMDFADDYYDYNNYGRNEKGDGAVLLLSMADRDWHFSTKGEAIKAFTDDAQRGIFSDDLVLGYFADDDWMGGLNCYVNECDKCISAYENGRTYKPFSFSDYIKYVGFSAIAGLIVAVLFIMIVKGRHKTVRMKAGANDYLVPGSLNMTQSYDTFAYKNVTKVRKDKDNDSGGSSTHRSSSGSIHGGSGGKF